MTLDLTDDERLAFARLLTRSIEDDPYPLSPRVRTWRVLAKLEPPPVVSAKPLPASKPGDRPRATLAAMKRRRRG